MDSSQQRFGRSTGVSADADVNVFHQAKHFVICVNLDDLGILGPVVDAGAFDAVPELVSPPF